MRAVLDIAIGCALGLGFIALASDAYEATLCCAVVAGIGLGLQSFVGGEG